MKYSLDKVGITQSMLSACMSCPRKFSYMCQGLRAKKPTSNALVFGDVMHDCLEHLYRHNIRDVDLLVDKAVERNPSSEDESNSAKAAALLRHYIDVYKNDFDNAAFLYTEYEFELLEGCVLWRGKIDGVLDRAGKMWLMEHKTKSQIDEDGLMLQLSFDFQSLFYVRIAETIFRRECAGVLYNVIRTPQHRQGKDTLPAFYERLCSEIGKNPEHFFKRYEVPYTKKDKEQFNGELLWKIARVQDLLVNATYPRNQDACATRYGYCEYLEACATESTRSLQKGKIFPELFVNI